MKLGKVIIAVLLVLAVSGLYAFGPKYEHPVYTNTSNRPCTK
jgi:hypothetical protein